MEDQNRGISRQAPAVKSKKSGLQQILWSCKSSIAQQRWTRQPLQSLQWQQNWPRHAMRGTHPRKHLPHWPTRNTRPAFECRHDSAGPRLKQVGDKRSRHRESCTCPCACETDPPNQGENTFHATGCEEHPLPAGRSDKVPPRTDHLRHRLRPARLSWVRRPPRSTLETEPGRYPTQRRPTR